MSYTGGSSLGGFRKAPDSDDNFILSIQDSLRTGARCLLPQNHRRDAGRQIAILTL
jgi:hypothetical protein